MGETGIRGLKARVGRECCINRGRASWSRLKSGGIQAGGVREGSHRVVFRRIRGQLQE